MMRSLLRPTAVLIVIGLTLCSGLLQGRMRNRWGVQPDLQAAGTLLEATPANFGDWELTKRQPLSGAVAKMLECAGALCGTYRHRVTGDELSMFVIVGPPGPISVHTPDICYASRDFTVVGQRAQTDLPATAGPADEFWALTLRSHAVGEQLLRVYYAWSDGRAWAAANDPRFSYGGAPLLYKLQVAGAAAHEAGPEAEDLGYRFLRDFLPVLRSHLVNPRREAT